MRFSTILGTVFATLAVTFTGSMALGQPGNDNCANASVITIPSSGYSVGVVYSDSSFDLNGATVESGENFAPGLPTAKSMWFKFTLPTTRYLRLQLLQVVGNSPQIADTAVAASMWRSSSCMPGSGSVVNPVISKIKDEGIYRCHTAADYYVQVTAESGVAGKVYLKLTFDESKSVDGDTLYDLTSEAHDFGNIIGCRNTTVRSTVTYKAGCQSIDQLENNCSVSSYTKSSWHILTTDSHVDVLRVAISATGGTGSGFGIRLYKGNVKTGGYGAITAEGSCFTNATSGYWPCLDANTVYSLQILYPTTYYTTALTVDVYEWGCGPTQSPDPKNIPAAYEGTLSTYNSPLSFTDSFACNALMANYITPLNCTGIVNTTQTVSGHVYDMNIWVKFTTTVNSDVQLRLDRLNAQYSPVAFRVYDGDVESAGFSCNSLIAAYTTNNANVLLRCRTPQTYSIQILGRANFSGFTSYPGGTNLSGHVKLTATLLPLITEKFSRRTIADVEMINAGADLMPDSLYQMTRDTFDCWETPIPRDGLYSGCQGQLTPGTGDDSYGGQRGMYRVIQVGHTGELDIFTNCCCSGCSSSFMLYAGDVTDDVNFPLDAGGDSILNLVRQRPECHDTTYCFSCDCHTYRITPGRYTLVAFGQVGWHNQPSVRLRVWDENWHFRTANFATEVDRLNNGNALGEGSYNGVIDTFDVWTTPLPPAPRCDGDRAIYRSFYLDKRSLVTLSHNDNPHYNSGECQGCQQCSGFFGCWPYEPMDKQIFSGRPTSLSGNTVQGLTDISGCDTQATSHNLGCVDTGWYTVVTYGDSCRIGFTNNLTVNVVQPEEVFHYRQPDLANVDTVSPWTGITNSGTYNFTTDEYDCDTTPLPPNPTCTGKDRAIYRSFVLGAAGTLNFYNLGTSQYELYQGCPNGYDANGDVAGLTLLKSCGQNLNGCYSPGCYTLVLYGTSANINQTRGGYFTYAPAAPHVFDLANNTRIDSLPHNNPSAPMAIDTVYQDSMDCLSCNTTRLPYKQYDCATNVMRNNFPTHDRAVFRTIEVPSNGILTVKRWQYQYWSVPVPHTELHVYKGDASDVNNWTADSIYNLTDVSGDLFFGSCGIRLCVTPGRYTIVEFGADASKGFCMQNRYCFKPVTSSFAVPTSPDNMGAISSSDTFKIASGSYFTCTDNPYTVTYPGGSTAPQSGYTKQIYHEFELSEDACVTIRDRSQPHTCGSPTSVGGCDGTCDIYRNLFAGRLSTGSVTGVERANIYCNTYSPSLTDICLEQGWYTMVTYGRGAVYGDTSQCDVAGGNGVSAIGLKDSFVVYMSKPVQKFDTPAKAQSIESGNPLNWFAQPARGHSGNLPIQDYVYCPAYELFDCKRDAVPPCITALTRSEYTSMTFSVFTLSKTSYVHIVGLDNSVSSTTRWPGGSPAGFQSRLYAGDIKAGCTAGSPLTLVQDSIYDEMRLTLNAGSYTLVTYTTPSSCCKDLTPLIYVDSSSESQFDHAKNAYNFNLIPKNGTYHYGKDITTDTRGANPSNDFIFETTTAHDQHADIEYLKYLDCGPGGCSWPYCGVDMLEEYGDTIQPPLPYPHDPIRNIWYSFVVQGTGKVTVDVRKLTESTARGCPSNDTTGYGWSHDPCNGQLDDLCLPFAKDDTTQCHSTFGYGASLCSLASYSSGYNDCDLFDIGLFESPYPVTGSSPYPVVQDSSWLDSLIVRGHTYIDNPSCPNYGQGEELGDSIDRVPYYIPECDDQLRRFWVVVTTRRATEPMLQFDMRVKFEDLSIVGPYFDHFTTADTVVKDLSGCETTSWANLYCNTRDTSDKYLGLYGISGFQDTTLPWCDNSGGGCGYGGYGFYDSTDRHTAWYTFDLPVGGEVKMTLQRTGHEICGTSNQIKYDQCELVLYKYIKNPPYTDSIVCSGIERVYHTRTTTGTGDTTNWGVWCLDPGRYYVFIPGIECSFDSVRVHICQTNIWPGNTMDDPVNIDFTGTGVKTARMTVNCFTIGEAPGEDSPAGMGCLTRSTPSSTECCENAPSGHKSGWFQVTNTSSDTLDYEFLMTNYLSNYTAQDVGFRLGFTQPSQPPSSIGYTAVCVTTLQNNPIITCVPPGYTIWVQTVMPTAALGDLELRVTATLSAVGCSPPVVLPLNLLFFDAEFVGGQVVCSWGMVEEGAVARYYIERMLPNEGFTDLGSLSARHSGGHTNYYSFVDPNPASGLNYYRLRIEHVDGYYSHSPVRSVTYRDQYFHLIPNPTSSSARLLFYAHEGGIVHVEVTNKIGELVEKASLDVSGGHVEHDLSLKSLPAGAYWVTVRSNGRILRKTLIKQ